MKVYFTTSPRAIKEYKENIFAIYSAVEKLGWEHASDFIVKVDVEKFYDAEGDDIARFYKDTTADLKTADVAIFEVSMHSLAVGQLADMAYNLGKPIIALHTQGNAPYFLSGLEDEKLQIIEYSVKNIETQLKQALDFASDQQDTRFNFFISPKHQNYLDWVSKNKKIPRAVYLRRLIEKDMEKNEEYS